MLCKQSKKTIVTLMEPPVVIVHGEYYPENILFFEHTIYPVDWESAAIAIGDIDLASLIEKWPQEIVRDCVGKYQSTRWPQGPPAGFEQKLDTAQLYWLFRWLGDRPDWTQHPDSTKRFERLRSFGERLGLI
jgi:thiamine kinase-like enzyme